MNELDYAITAGPYTARIAVQGAALRQLRHGARDLVVPFELGAPIPDFRGVIAAPWPNRLADGRYTWAGKRWSLPLTEPARHTALHGLVHAMPWELVRHDAAALTLRCTVPASAGYPPGLQLRASYRLAEDGLHCQVTAQNAGELPLPYGLCPHPYLVAGPSPLAQWRMQSPAEYFLAVDAERLLPVGLQPVAGHPFDFRRPRPLGELAIDHAFTGLGRGGELLLTDPAGGGVGMAWGEELPWLQVHTADKSDGSPHRIAVAVEPMSCPPDAFNSGTDLVTLAPGGQHTANWRIFAVDAAAE